MPSGSKVAGHVPVPRPLQKQRLARPETSPIQANTSSYLSHGLWFPFFSAESSPLGGSLYHHIFAFAHGWGTPASWDLGKEASPNHPVISATLWNNDRQQWQAHLHGQAEFVEKKHVSKRSSSKHSSMHSFLSASKSKFQILLVTYIDTHRYIYIYTNGYVHMHFMNDASYQLPKEWPLHWAEALNCKRRSTVIHFGDYLKCLTRRQVMSTDFPAMKSHRSMPPKPESLHAHFFWIGGITNVLQSPFPGILLLTFAKLSSL